MKKKRSRRRKKRSRRKKKMRGGASRSSKMRESRTEKCRQPPRADWMRGPLSIATQPPPSPTATAAPAAWIKRRRARLKREAAAWFDGTRGTSAGRVKDLCKLKKPFYKTRKKNIKTRKKEEQEIRNKNPHLHLTKHGTNQRWIRTSMH